MDQTHTNNLCVSGSYKKLFEFHREDSKSRRTFQNARGEQETIVVCQTKTFLRNASDTHKYFVCVGVVQKTF